MYTAAWYVKLKTSKEEIYQITVYSPYSRKVLRGQINKKQRIMFKLEYKRTFLTLSVPYFATNRHPYYPLCAISILQWFRIVS
jgi:hypothetical protein